MKKLFGLIFNRWTLGLVGLVAVAVLIWFVGPLIEIADYAPLEPPWIRQLAIGAVVLLYLLKGAWTLIKASATNRQLVDALLRPAPSAAAEAPGPGAEEVELLRKRFEDSIRTLKRARFGNASTLSALGASASRQYLYELPWYVIIGAPGSGKTTALRNAGLDFPLTDQVGTDPVRGVGGTRNCDWWFTDQAVLLDTAGRYATQDSDAQADQAAWDGFLGLLKTYRPRRPINGVLLTVSVADLLEQDAQQRATHARKLRARIQELHERIGIRFPIYVLLTKIDLLAGFTEFFGEAGKEERAQVWGVTFPYVEDANQANPLIMLPTELAQLDRRLNDRLIDRLQGERDADRRAAIYGFPQQWNALRDTLDEFLREVFAPSRFEQRPLLRGVYFTSGTQEGTPIDRLVGGLGRALGLAPHPAMSTRQSGKSFFLSRLLKDVVFQEAGLAGANLRWERRRALIQWGAASAAALACLAVIGAWSVSYLRNRAYVADVARKVEHVSKQLAALPATGKDVVSLLPLLQSVRDLAATPSMADAGVPYTMGWGLYQGDKLGAASRSAHLRLLHDALLPRLVARIEQLLATGVRANPELLYEALKTYVMLHEPRRFDAQAIELFVTADWESSLPRTLSRQERSDLESQLDLLLASGQVVSPLPADAELLALARASVAQIPLAVRAYSRLRRLEVGADLPEFTIAKHAGPQALLVLERPSGQPLTAGIGGLYTYAGYHKAFVAASSRIASQLADEAEWVLGRPQQAGAASEQSAARERLTEDVRRLYLEDYARQWEALIRDIRVIQPTSLQKTVEITRVLASAAESPVARLFRAVAREVTLADKPAAEKTAIDKGSEALKAKGDELRKLLGTSSASGVAASAPSLAEQIVDARFAPIRRLVTAAAPGSPAPIDAAASLMNELNTYMIAATTAVEGKMAPPPADPVVNKLRAEAARIGEPVGSMLTSLSSTATGLVFGSSLDVLNGLLKTAVHEPCVKALQGRYPLTRGSPHDATADDFTRVFGPGGILDDFFGKHLQASVDTSTHPWTFRKVAGAAVGGDARTLEQFRRADTIRKVFFRGSATPVVRLQLRPLEMDPSITQFLIDVDGQPVRYSHGPQVATAIQWPGPSGRQEVRVEVAPPSSTGASALSVQGPWALFRLFERAELQPSPQPEKFSVGFNVDGRKAKFEVIASSVQNPFRLRELAEFQCPLRF